MKTNQWKWKRRNHRTGESGQAMLFYILVLGTFLLGALLFAFDVSNMWFHRQSAQSAADAACAAGAMDLYIASQGASTGHQGFTAGTAYSCSTTSTDSVCSYAAKNGYNSNSTGNSVSVSFPSSVIGCASGCKPPSAMTANPFIRVDILDHVPTFFAGLINGSTTKDVRAFSVCGAELATAPIPIVVLDPQSPNSTPAQSALNVQGNGTIAIVGGPTQSIQVNSAATSSSCGQSNCSTNQPWGSAKIDLSLGGPSQTGSNIGLWGSPASAPAGFLPGTTGSWVAPSAPIADPFAQVCAPGQSGCPAINGNAPPPVPGNPIVPTDVSLVWGTGASATACEQPAGNSNSCTGNACSSDSIKAGKCYVSHGIHGCPDPGAVVPARPNTGCVLYTAGAYPAQIEVKAGVAIFDPGLYYVTGGGNPALQLDSGSTVRPGTGAGDGSGGVTFYFVGSDSVTVNSNSGKKTGLDVFNTTSGTGSYATGIKCTGSSTSPSNVPATIPLNNGTDGANILLGPCTGYYGDPLGASDPLGVQRGFLFFQDRSGQSANPDWGGGGQFLLAGTMYFHSCNSTGTGTGCGAPPTYYNDIFKMLGNSGSGTYVLGSIVADNLTLGGSSGITMDLNPTKAYSTMKVSILQ
jgi:Putative Flp pilus-assembly TadE/G-like